MCYVYRGRTCITPDGLFLAVTMRDCIDIYNTETRLPTTSLRPVSGLNAPIMLIHGGTSLVGTMDGNTVRLWSMPSGIKLATILHDGELSICACVPDRSDIGAEQPDGGPIVALAVSHN